jgi:hypothetical protein
VITLQIFFPYFGGKHRLAPRYPAPRHEWIIEPFAGSAGYATRYPGRRVLLIERNETVAGIWRYLTRATEREVLALPLLAPGQRVATLDAPPEARALIGFWAHPGNATPGTKLTQWPGIRAADTWSAVTRARIASQVPFIRHWQIRQASYETAPDVEADWFVDPPYQVKGNRYPCSAGELDFAELGLWCRARRGQVVVCENTGATWLPFRHFTEARSVAAGVSREALWTARVDPLFPDAEAAQ